MLYDSHSKRSPVSCRVHCKKCCRKEYHFLNVRGKVSRFLTRVLTLGTIGIFGRYRCVCCGSARLGRFDIIRGREHDFQFSLSFLNPLNWWFKRRDSWDEVKRRERRWFTRSSRKRYKHKPFRKRFW